MLAQAQHKFPTPWRRRLQRAAAILCLGLVAISVNLIGPSAIAADAKLENPSHPDWFKPNPDPRAGLDGWGPGGGPVRKDSTAADIHANVPGFAPARRCLTCHEGQDENLHYERTELVCRTCHGTGTYAGIRNPASPMFIDNRHKVCASCHEGATPSLATYVIHEPSPLEADTREDFPALYWATIFMVALAGTVFAVFLPYTALWAFRDLGAALNRYRHRREVIDEGQTHISRFNLLEAFFHTVLVITFMALSVTGLAWMFIDTEFGQALVGVFGGYQNAIFVHRIVGLLLMAIFVLHIVYMLSKIDWSNPTKSIKGPGSIAWTVEDFRNFWSHMKWVLGRGGAPTFDRWTWWQKFDYWAVWWGLVIVGTTGIILYDPILSSEYMPGWVLNVARWVHKIEALLAMGHIFIVHFYIESFRPHAFPVNLHGFHGKIDMDQARHEHGAWITRMQVDGTISHVLTSEPPVLVRIVSMVFGLASVALGLGLLVAGLATVFISWLS